MLSYPHLRDHVNILVSRTTKHESSAQSKLEFVFWLGHTCTTFLARNKISNIIGCDIVRKLGASLTVKEIGREKSFPVSDAAVEKYHEMDIPKSIFLCTRLERCKYHTEKSIFKKIHPVIKKDGLFLYAFLNK